MKRYQKRTAAALLAASLLISSFGSISFAAELTDDEPVISAEAETLTEEESEAIFEETEAAIEETEAAAEPETEAIPEEETEAVPEETFAEPEVIEEEFEEEAVVNHIATVTDAQGNSYHSYNKDGHGNYFLFVPQGLKLSETPVKMAGIVTSVDKGTLKNGELTGAFKKSGDYVTITDKNGNTSRLTVMQSNLPSVHISLNGTTIAQINGGKKDVKYTGNRVTVFDPAGETITKDNVEIKGRGNTTWAFAEKKGYQIKFEKKTALFGMEKAKKWVLLANAFDDSMLRNAVAFDLARSIGMKETPEYKFVDLFANGDYLGTYLLCEKVEIGEGRVNLKDDAAVLMEYDQAFYPSEDFWIRDPATGAYFVLKESNTEGNENQLMQNFTNKLDAFLTYVRNTPKTAITLAELGKYIDVNSFIRYYLITDFTYNVESWTTSFYLFMDGPANTIHLGPVWDFDSAMGSKYGFESVNGSWADHNPIMREMLTIPAFSDALSRFYNDNRSKFQAASANAKALGNQIASSAAMNYTRWNRLGQPCEKPDMIPFSNTYADAVNATTKWLSNRYTNFCVEGLATVIVKNGVIDIVYRGGGSAPQVAIWSEIGGQDDLHWVNLSRGADGFCHGYINITAFANTGDFTLHYQQNGQLIAAITTNISPVSTIASYTNAWKIGSYLYSEYPVSSVRFAVWSSVKGQDDLIWYNGTKNAKGEWTFEGDLVNHSGMGSYFIHAYGVVGGRSILLAGDTVTVTHTSLVTYNKISYTPVYSYNYYINRYSDLKKAFSGNPAAAARHFFLRGMNEGREGSPSFKVSCYMNNYADLKANFKNDLPAYYTHYARSGYKEGREAAVLNGPTYKGLNYSPIFSYEYYLNRYKDVAKAFGNNYEKVFQHFLNYGMREGRQGCEAFNVTAYKNRYSDLRRTFGDDLPAYYLHFLRFGVKEGRLGT